MKITLNLDYGMLFSFLCESILFAAAKFIIRHEHCMVNLVTISTDALRNKLKEIKRKQLEIQFLVVFHLQLCIWQQFCISLICLWLFCTSFSNLCYSLVVVERRGPKTRG